MGYTSTVRGVKVNPEEARGAHRLAEGQNAVTGAVVALGREELEWSVCLAADKHRCGSLDMEQNNRATR